MAFIFFINILISFPFSILMIGRNRGQLLDRPEWRVIPELTICFVLFTFSLLGSWIFPFFSQDTKKNRIDRCSCFGFCDSFSIFM